ncbi:hypothetical protein [Treponema sp.]|uniref:hypothetical protein n=1 Tax=Treponema sp. TaxID=166 RepID=UPI00388D8124
MNSTEWLKMNLPGYDDAADILKLSENFDTLDRILKSNADIDTETKAEIERIMAEILKVKDNQLDDMRNVTIAINEVNNLIRGLDQRVTAIEEGEIEREENYVYYGQSTAATPTQSQMNSLNKIMTNVAYRDLNISVSNAYWYYALPVRFGTVRFEVSGFTGGFLEPTVMVLSGEDYYVYRSIQVLNGSATIIVKA